MSRSIDLLLQAAERGDFAASTSILLGLCRTEISQDVVSHFLNYEKNLPPSLRLRDHVFFFLGLTPLYCAIQSSSIDVLKQFDGMSTLEHIRHCAFDWARNLLENEDEGISLRYLDSDRVLNDQYATLLPLILERKAKELESCRIYARSESDRKSYSIFDLDRTSYGHLLLLGSGQFGTGTEASHSIIQENDWNEIEKALISLGYDPDDMIVELDDAAWSSFTSEKREESIHTSSSFEVCSTRELYDASVALNLAVDEATIQKIGIYRSNYANKQLMHLAEATQGIQKQLVIEALIDSGDTSILGFLSSLMATADHKSRRVIARGISSITSAMSGFDLNVPQIQEQPRSDDAVASTILTLAKYAGHRKPSVRLDALRTLSTFDDIRAHNLIRNAIETDESPHVRIAIVALAFNLPREIAASILRVALNDENPSVSLEAEKAILHLGWDFSNEYSDEQQNEFE